MTFGKKLKACRLSEKMSRDEMSALVGVPVKTIANAEQGVCEPRAGTITKITSSERFKKYGFWLLTGETMPESGQICPENAILERCGLVDYAGDVSVEQGRRLRAVRIEEGLNITEMSLLLNLEMGILSQFESGCSDNFGEIVARATNHTRFKKYAFWIMTGDAIPNSGQVRPASHVLRRCGIKKDKK